MVFKRNRVAATLTDTELGYLDGVTPGTGIASKAMVQDSSGNFGFIDSDSLFWGTDGDVEIRWDGTDLDILAMTNNYIIKWGTGTNSFDQWWFGSSASLYFSFDASANDLKFEDSVSLMFGTGSAAGPGAAGDVEIRWDGTDLDVLGAADDLMITVGNGTNSFDVKVFGNTTSLFTTWDASASEWIFEDSVSLNFGTGLDVDIRWDGTDLDILGIADDLVINVGNGTNSFDVKVFGNTTSLFWTWDASASEFIFEDSVSLNFGTGLDVDIRWDGTDLDILGIADDLVIKFGNGTNSFDIWTYGNTASDYMLWDASLSKLTFEGAAYVDLSGGHRYTLSAIVANTAPTADDSGKVYIINGGTGVTFTLPAVATSAGVHYKVFNGVNQNFILDGPANTLVLFNDITATSLTFSQAGELVGNSVEAFCDGSFWYVAVHLAAEAVTSIVA